MPRTEDHDVLIVGSGIAGLSAALSVRHRHVTVLSGEAPLAGSSSGLAQGGLAAAVGIEDSSASHLQDTLAAGPGASSHVAAVIVSLAKTAVHFLLDQGVRFDRDDAGWQLHREGGHRCARVLRCQGDATGAGILQALLSVARECRQIELRNGAYLLELIQHDGRVCGITARQSDGETVALYARDVVLATGGVGQMFRHTTNPRSACGDGLAAALAAGARTSGLEFVQFHPTALRVDSDPLPLLSEALRGAGATLLDDWGRRFVQRWHPSAELAPRDIVAQAVWEQLKRGAVFIDATHLGPERLAREFPTITRLCQSHRLDPNDTPIPIMPAAHFHMGGVDVDLDGRSSLPGLWCCGEVAHTGLHGANRLASNSLLEAVVCGRLTGEMLSHGAHPPVRSPASSVDLHDDEELPAADDPVWAELRHVMWRHAGIVRNADGLQNGIKLVHELSQDLRPTQGVLQRRLQLAEAILTAALRRGTTQGAHIRSDAVRAA